MSASARDLALFNLAIDSKPWSTRCLRP